MPASILTLLYTARLHGQLDRLPRLFSLIRQARAAAPGPVLLLDLGESCDPAVTECAATEGRAALFVLDAMGYDLACLTAAEGARLSPEAVQRVLERVSLKLCGPVQPGLPPVVTQTVGGWRVAVLAQETDSGDLPSAALVIQPVPGLANPELHGKLVGLPPVRGDQLGVVAVVFGDHDRTAVRVEGRVDTLLPATPGDATVAAAVAFVGDEIRDYRRAG